MPSYKQRRLSKMMIREGVDHIIGAHPHVVQPIEIIKDEKGDHLIAYSLGNFISNQKKPLTDGGIMLRMRLVRDQNNIQLDHYDVVPIWRYIRAGNKNTFEVIPTSLFKSDTSHFHTIHSYLNMVKHDSYIESFFTEK